MVSAFLCILGTAHVAPAFEVQVISTTLPLEQSMSLRNALSAEANRWADRYFATHKTSDGTKVELVIQMPFSLPDGVTGRDVQFHKGAFLKASVKVGEKEIPFNLVYGDGEWTRDSRYRKANNLDTVLHAYVRKAVDKGLGLALGR